MGARCESVGKFVLTVLRSLAAKEIVNIQTVFVNGVQVLRVSPLVNINLVLVCPETMLT